MQILTTSPTTRAGFGYFQLEYGSEARPLVGNLVASGVSRLRFDFGRPTLPNRVPTLPLNLSIVGVADGVVRSLLGVSTVWPASGGIVEVPLNIPPAASIVSLRSFSIGLGRLESEFLLERIEAVGSSAAGDVNRDETVSMADLLEWQRDYGGRVRGITADANGDGAVNAADYTVWRDALPAGTAVPEPSAAAVATLAVAVLQRRRR
ncbi:MAG: dockerin type I domain-containing protein [Lacipirellulaceae bacterium]